MELTYHLRVSKKRNLAMFAAEEKTVYVPLADLVDDSGNDPAAVGDYAWTVEDDGIYEAIPMGIFKYPDGTGNKLRKGSVYSAGSVFDCGGERREFNKNVWLSQKMMGFFTMLERVQSIIICINCMKMEK